MVVVGVGGGGGGGFSRPPWVKNTWVGEGYTCCMISFECLQQATTYSSMPSKSCFLSYFERSSD